MTFLNQPSQISQLYYRKLQFLIPIAILILQKSKDRNVVLPPLIDLPLNPTKKRRSLSGKHRTDDHVNLTWQAPSLRPPIRTADRHFAARSDGRERGFQLNGRSEEGFNRATEGADGRREIVKRGWRRGEEGSHGGDWGTHEGVVFKIRIRVWGFEILEAIGGKMGFFLGFLEGSRVKWRENPIIHGFAKILFLSFPLIFFLDFILFLSPTINGLFLVLKATA